MMKMGLMAGVALSAGMLNAGVITLEATGDAWVNGNVPNTNYGTEVNGSVRNDSTNNYAQHHPLFKFDTAAITSTLNSGETIEVTSVRMRFYTSLSSWPASPTNFSDVVMYRNTADFSESTVTWNTKPTTDATEVARLTYFGQSTSPTYFTGVNTISSGTTGWLEFQSDNVKDLVEGWVNGTVNNYGITIRGGDNYTGTNRRFLLSSKESTNESVRPEIIVDYNVIPEPATLGLFSVSAAGLLMVRRLFSDG
jgi:hypothetical protein